jgi:hypothetical protein
VGGTGVAVGGKGVLVTIGGTGVFSGESGVALAVGEAEGALSQPVIKRKKSITTTLILDCTDMVRSVPVLQWRIPKGHFIGVVSL